MTTSCYLVQIVGMATYAQAMHRPAYESDAFSLAVGVAEVGLKLSSLALGLWPLVLRQKTIFSSHRS